MKGLSLNFAAMRSILEGETGDGVTQRVERWALRRLSGVLQIETLWRFNAKYEPRWLPRYIVFDSAEQFVPGGRADHAGRVADRGPRHRPPPHHGRGQAGRAGGARRGPGGAWSNGDCGPTGRPRRPGHAVTESAARAAGIRASTSREATAGPARAATGAGPSSSGANARRTMSEDGEPT